MIILTIRHFTKKISQMQCNIRLAITVSITCFSLEISQEPGLRSIDEREWYKKLCCPIKLSYSSSEDCS